MALLFFQNPSLERESNPHAILIRIWFFSPLKLQKVCELDWTIHGILFDGENISFDASLVIYIYINSINIPPIMIINRIYEHQNLLSL
jgi:hypothetical protein